jgi:hypothetical protein
MGLVVRRRKIVQLDTDVVSALVRDTTAQQLVQSFRREGARILVCPTVVFQIGQAGAAERRRRALALLDYCDGYTRAQGPGLVLDELRALSEGRRIETIEEFPISELGDYFLGPVPPRTVPNWAVRAPRVDLNGALNEIRRIYKGHHGEVRSFFQALGEYLPPYIKILVDATKRATGKEAELPSDMRLLKRLAPRSALLNGPLLLVANLYRGITGTYSHGGGSLSDTQVIAECAYADVLLTRDEEFIAAWSLVRELASDICPEVVRVPRAA